MGQQNSKQEPKKSDEDLMRERWANLTQSSKKPESEKNENSIQNKQNPSVITNKDEKPNKIQSNSQEIKQDSPKTVNIQENVNMDKIKISQPVINQVLPTEISSINPGSSPKITTDSQIKIQSNLIEPKKLDKEHSTIEKIFRISLIPSEKFNHLQIYQAQLISENKEEVFRLNDLDNIILAIINEGNKKENIITYLLETYHRAIEMIEKRYRNEYDDNYLQVRRMIASYMALIMYAPENFEFNLDYNDTLKRLSEYFDETDPYELQNLISDIVQTTLEDFSFLNQVLSYIITVIHTDNTNPKNNFFNCDKMKKNLNILLKIFNDYPITREVYVRGLNFLPKGANAKMLQSMSLLGAYLSLSSFEADVNSIKVSFSSMVNSDSDVNIRNFTFKLNSLLNEITTLFYLLITDAKSKSFLLNYLCDVGNLNLERKKMYSNPYLVSTIGFLLNTSIVLLKILFDHEHKNSSVFEIVAEIDILYTSTASEIQFNKHDRINDDASKDSINSDKLSSENFNMTTKLFFIIHNILSYFIKNLDDEYTKLAQQLSNMFKMNAINDPRFKELLGMLKAVDVYLRNPEFTKNIMKLNQVTCLLIFSLNNKKYFIDKSNLQNFKNLELCSFIEDFYENIDTSNLYKLSILPNFIVKNIISSSLLLRKFYSEAIISDMIPTKIITYFSIIYSSQVNLIVNPHLRSEIFDVLFYFFDTSQQERNSKQIANLYKLLNEEFIKNNMIYSLIRVFVDAERLGTNNQFYEKFAIRHKILTLLDNIMKSGYRSIYTDKFIEVSNREKFDTTKMVNLLMNDVTYLIDESIERLMAIKKYQDLRDDLATYNQLDQETRQMEEERFRENDNRVKPGLQLLNSSINFMVTIASFAQESFMSYKLSERLANLLNYSLDVFTSKKNLKLKVIIIVFIFNRLKI